MPVPGIPNVLPVGADFQPPPVPFAKGVLAREPAGLYRPVAAIHAGTRSAPAAASDPAANCRRVAVIGLCLVLAVKAGSPYSAVIVSYLAIQAVAPILVAQWGHLLIFASCECPAGEMLHARAVSARCVPIRACKSAQREVGLPTTAPPYPADWAKLFWLENASAPLPAARPAVIAAEPNVNWRRFMDMRYECGMADSIFAHYEHNTLNEPCQESLGPANRPVQRNME